MHKLKPLQIKNAKIGKQSDGGGLYFVKTKESAKWIYRFSVDGKRREMGLGSYPAVGLAEARKDRDKWAAVLRSGLDPIIERNKQRREAAEEREKDDPTFEDLALLAYKAKKASLRGEGTRGRWFSPIKLHVIPKLGRKRTSQIIQDDIEKILKPLWKKMPHTARKTHQRLRYILEYGQLKDFEADPLQVDKAIATMGELDLSSNPITATPWQDIPALYAKLDKPAASHRALRLMILTAVRAHAVRGALKDEFEDDVWTVPAERIKGTKGKVKDFRVPLSTQAQAEIAEWMGETDEAHLFAGIPGKPISDQALHKVLNGLGEEGRPHGFRSSFRTWIQETEAAQYDVAETALGHIIGNKVERSYARSDLLDHRRVLMQRWADFVTGVEAKVIRLSG